MHKITIMQMIGYGDRTRREAEVVRLFQEKYPELPPISQGTVSKIEKQFRERGHVRQLKKNPPNKLSDDQKLDVMLMLGENPHTSSRQTDSALNISHSSILRVLSENQMHPYKLVPTNELAEDDCDRRILFCEKIVQMIDDNTLQIENVLFSDESTFTLYGHVKRQSCRYWSRENPHWMRELHTKTVRIPSSTKSQGSQLRCIRLPPMEAYLPILNPAASRYPSSCCLLHITDIGE
ncbi:hypothetical protein NQ318_004728 [Aromia moschata]|uniref:DUF4817 domain-containing protein n=1 Tax=Aromia moschata TaxID=1265417 RepID=A0AAV8Y1B5_9CUCU|nr:hypothetical protein NQ318_004728 [Aromia moschata]